MGKEAKGSNSKELFEQCGQKPEDEPKRTEPKRKKKKLADTGARKKKEISVSSFQQNHRKVGGGSNNTITYPILAPPSGCFWQSGGGFVYNVING